MKASGRNELATTTKMLTDSTLSFLMCLHPNPYLQVMNFFLQNSFQMHSAQLQYNELAQFHNVCSFHITVSKVCYILHSGKGIFSVLTRENVLLKTVFAVFGCFSFYTVDLHIRSIVRNKPFLKEVAR